MCIPMMIANDKAYRQVLNSAVACENCKAKHVCKNYGINNNVICLGCARLVIYGTGKQEKHTAFTKVFKPR